MRLGTSDCRRGDRPIMSTTRSDGHGVIICRAHKQRQDATPPAANIPPRSPLPLHPFRTVFTSPCLPPSPRRIGNPLQAYWKPLADGPTWHENQVIMDTRSFHTSLLEHTRSELKNETLTPPSCRAYHTTKKLHKKKYSGRPCVYR